jgi:hypothetical protein
MAFSTSYRGRLLFIPGELSVATYAHPMICLPQGAFGRIQIRLKPESGLILVACRTLDARSAFFKFPLIQDVLSTFKPVVTIGALNSGIDMLHVGKGHRRPARISEYRLVIQQDIFRLSVEIDRPQEDSDTQNQHANQKMSPCHAPLPGCDPLMNNNME